MKPIHIVTLVTTLLPVAVLSYSDLVASAETPIEVRRTVFVLIGLLASLLAYLVIWLAPCKFRERSQKEKRFFWKMSLGEILLHRGSPSDDELTLLRLAVHQNLREFSLTDLDSGRMPLSDRIITLVKGADGQTSHLIKAYNLRYYVHPQLFEKWSQPSESGPRD